MVVTPGDLRKLKSEDNVAIKEIEKKIDAVLLENDDRDEIVISMKVIGQQKQKVINAVITMYWAAGWEVLRDSDKDGSYLKFRERVQRSSDGGGFDK